MTVGVIRSTGVIIYFNPVFCPKLDLVCFPTDLLFLDIQLLYYYINVRSSIIFPLYSGDIYLFPGNLLSNPVLDFTLNCPRTIHWWSSWDFRNFISYFITNQITCCLCIFLNCFFWSSLKCICYRLLSMIKNFLVFFTSWVFTYFFTNVFSHIFSIRQRSEISCYFQNS